MNYMEQVLFYLVLLLFGLIFFFETEVLSVALAALVLTL